MNIQELCDEYPENWCYIGPEYPRAAHFIGPEYPRAAPFIGPEYPGDLGMSRRFMLDRPPKRAQECKKSPGKFCHRIFCPGIK